MSTEIPSFSPGSNVPEQIPARMINQYTYCPRLFYLEYSQGEWAHNTETLEGRFAHRRVDKQQGSVPAPDELKSVPKLHSRSVTVGSDKLGAIARIDLIEMEGERVIPVDYKRGEPPDTPEYAWEPERVQVCLQGLLLRENGYECDEGALYFVKSQQRVRVPLTDELITRTLELLEQARRASASGEIPPPLINSPKCPRCSLVGICLPDETNLLRATSQASTYEATTSEVEPSALRRAQISSPDSSQSTESLRNQSSTARHKAELRRLVPARDDHTAVYVQGQGYSLGLKGEVLQVREKGKTIREVRLMEVSQLNLFGNVQLSAQALRELAARDVTILHLSYGGWLTAVTTPPPHKNIELRRRQFLAAGDSAICLQLARAFVSGKIRNSRTLLRRNARELPDGALNRLAQSRHRTEQATELGQLLGVEGAAAREYFSNFALTFKTDDGARQPKFDFQSRNRRPPQDPVNALLSFLYAMLAKDMVATLVGIGFDPYLGFYHQVRYGRPALALDLMEEFRPLVADSTAVGLINNGEIRPSDFIHRAGAVALTDSGRKRVIEAYERRVDMLITHPTFGYTISYRRVFEVQARLLAKFLVGETNVYPPFCTR